ncbi:hypothetical protein Barb7_00049 [Bacteroidales bacterium Barb7]|nr:hypothetical protein Barb7_00050 [Bacteroidales bacterium Barb7]OAV76335.1 hypothetical protein Barb7_00049 [Bacteroidales bacterium Barb7]
MNTLTIKRENTSDLFRFAWFRDFDKALCDLRSLAMEEEWDYKLNPTGKPAILRSYIHHTFSKLQQEGKIEATENYCIFNTGLATENQEEIFGHFGKNKKPDASSPWFFYGWEKSSSVNLRKFSKLPETADYFTAPSDLIYDSSRELRINIDHIIEDNKNRFPESLKVMDNYMLGNILLGTVNDAKRRVKRNYKTAIPQFFNGRIQLLLPLCLEAKNKADLALTVQKENDSYHASTCLTLDMAMNNARLIAKPDDEWLKI